MQTLNTYERRSLGFEINIQGIDYKDLKGSLVFEVENVEYGFPVSIMQDHISVSIPPLKDVVMKGLDDKKIIRCHLVVHGQGFILEPWSGEFELHSPVRMEAKMLEVEDSDYTPSSSKSTKNLKPKITVEGKMKKNIEEQSTELSDDELINMFKKKILKENKIKKPVKKSKSREQLASDLVSKKLNEINNTVDRVLKSDIFLNEYKQSKPVKQKFVKKVEQNIKKKSNPSDVQQLFESVGLKNKTIQKKLIDRAIELGGDDEQSIFTTVEKMLGVKTEGTLFNQYVERQYEKDKKY